MKEGLRAGAGPGTSEDQEQILDGRKLNALNTVSRLTIWVAENLRQTRSERAVHRRAPSPLSEGSCAHSIFCADTHCIPRGKRQADTAHRVW
jgi:hypothetical protein